MIAIEPAPSARALGESIRRRDLSQFLAASLKAIGITGKVSVLLTGDKQIRVLNREFRRQDKPTDVLSFPAPDFAPRGHLGDLAISLETASRQAGNLGHSLQTEVKVLLLHGLLHLAGEDHETDSGEMARRETRLRKALDLPIGLIERSRQPAGRRKTRTTPARTTPARKTPARQTVVSRTAPAGNRRRSGSAGA